MCYYYYQSFSFASFSSPEGKTLWEKGKTSRQHCKKRKNGDVILGLVTGIATNYYPA